MSIEAHAETSDPRILAKTEISLPQSTDDARVMLIRDRLSESRDELELGQLCRANRSLEPFLLALCAEAPHVDQLVFRDLKCLIRSRGPYRLP